MLIFIEQYTIKAVCGILSDFVALSEYIDFTRKVEEFCLILYANDGTLCKSFLPSKLWTDISMDNTSKVGLHFLAKISRQSCPSA